MSEPSTPKKGGGEGQAPRQPLDRGIDCHPGDVHGGAGHLDRQRRPAVYRRRPGRGQEPEYLGLDQLSGLQRHRLAFVRLVYRDSRPQAILHGLRVLVHGQFGMLWRRAEHRVVDFGANLPGDRRRWPPAVGAGHPDRHIPQGEARHGDGGLRRGRGRGADPRADFGRVHHRQLLLAVDLLYQHTGRNPLAHPDPLHHRRPARHGRENEGGAVQGDQHRLRRPGVGVARSGVAGGDLRQGSGVGLVQRPVLACPGVHDLRGGRPVGFFPLGVATSQPDRQRPAARRAKLSWLRHDHLHLFRRSLRGEPSVTADAPGVVRLRRLSRRVGHVSGCILHDGGDADRRISGWQESRRPIHRPGRTGFACGRFDLDAGFHAECLALGVESAPGV